MAKLKLNGFEHLELYVNTLNALLKVKLTVCKGISFHLKIAEMTY